MMKYHISACPMGHPYQAKLQGAFCDKCDEAILVYNTSEEAAWLGFRDQIDSQAARELEGIRKRLKLTQAQAAKLAGGGKNAARASQTDGGGHQLIQAAG